QACDPLNCLQKNPSQYQKPANEKSPGRPAPFDITQGSTEPSINPASQSPAAPVMNGSLLTPPSPRALSSSPPLPPSFLSSPSSSSHSYPSPSLVVDLFKVLHCLPNKTEAQGSFMLLSSLQIAQLTLKI